MSDTTVAKRCECDPAKWTKCDDDWYMRKFQWKGATYAPNLTRYALVVLGETFTAKTRAEEIAELVRTAIRAGSYVPAKAVQHARPSVEPGAPLSRLIPLFDADVIDGDVKKRDATKRDNRNDLARFAKFTAPAHGKPLGDVPIDTITAGDLVKFRESPRIAKLTPSTWAKYRTIVQMFFAWAVGEKHVAVNPFGAARADQSRKLARGKSNGRNRRIDEIEEAALLKAAGRARDEGVADRLWALIIAAVESGLRVGELLALQWRDLNFDQRTIYVQAKEIGAAKTGAARPVPMSQRLADVLDGLKLDPTGKPWGRSAYVFGDAIGGRVKDIRKAWQTCVLRAHGHEPVWAPRANGKTTGGDFDAASRAKLDEIDLHFHDWRHEAGSRWLESKAFDLATIQGIYGHASIETTARYLHARTTSARTSMQLFDQQRRAVVVEKTVGAGAVGAPIEGKPSRNGYKRGTNGKPGAATGSGPRLVKGRKSRSSM